MSEPEQHAKSDQEIVQKLFSENLISGIITFDEFSETLNTTGEGKDD